MTSIFYAEPELVIALNTKVIFVNPNDLQIFKEIEIAEDLTTCGLKLAIPENEQDDPDEVQQKKGKVVQQEPASIQQVRLAPNRQLLAVTTIGQKALLLFQCRLEHAKLVSVRALARASSALAFSHDSKSLLVTDKTGDCYHYDCVDLVALPKFLFGHLSIVYDALWTDDQKFIVTCDRDDKIRITNYPSTYDIHGYCLGHKEFVAGLLFLQGEAILSISGDKTMRVWDFLSGQQLANMELPAPGIRLSLRSVNTDKFQAAVLLHQPDECVGIYDIHKNDLQNWEIKEVRLLSFPAMIASNICFVNESVYVSGIVDNHFKLEVATITGAPLTPANWLKMVEEQFGKAPWKPEDVSAWFKKRYDNVSDYLERKKRRIEDKEAKFIIDAN